MCETYCECNPEAAECVESEDEGDEDGLEGTALVMTIVLTVLFVNTICLWCCSAWLYRRRCKYRYHNPEVYLCPSTAGAGDDPATSVVATDCNPARVDHSNADFPPVRSCVHVDSSDWKGGCRPDLRGGPLGLRAGEHIQAEWESTNDGVSFSDCLLSLATLGLFYLLKRYIVVQRYRALLVVTDHRVILKEEHFRVLCGCTQRLAESQISFKLKLLKYVCHEFVSPSLGGTVGGTATVSMRFHEYPGEGDMPEEQCQGFLATLLGFFGNLNRVASSATRELSDSGLVWGAAALAQSGLAWIWRKVLMDPSVVPHYAQKKTPMRWVTFSGTVQDDEHAYVKSLRVAQALKEGATACADGEDVPELCAPANDAPVRVLRQDAAAVPASNEEDGSFNIHRSLVSLPSASDDVEENGRIQERAEGTFLFAWESNYLWTWRDIWMTVCTLGAYYHTDVRWRKDHRKSFFLTPRWIISQNLLLPAPSTREVLHSRVDYWMMNGKPESSKLEHGFHLKCCAVRPQPRLSLAFNTGDALVLRAGQLEPLSQVNTIMLLSCAVRNEIFEAVQMQDSVNEEEFRTVFSAKNAFLSQTNHLSQLGPIAVTASRVRLWWWLHAICCRLLPRTKHTIYVHKHGVALAKQVKGRYAIFAWVENHVGWDGVNELFWSNMQIADICTTNNCCDGTESWRLGRAEPSDSLYGNPGFHVGLATPLTENMDHGAAVSRRFFGSSVHIDDHISGVIGLIDSLSGEEKHWTDETFLNDTRSKLNPTDAITQPPSAATSAAVLPGPSAEARVVELIGEEKANCDDVQMIP